MGVLTLRLTGPLQAWGTSSRFTTRGTERWPSKSGIVGLLAASQGRSRLDPVDDLAALRTGVRVDVPGHLLREFQTCMTLNGSSLPRIGGSALATKLSERLFLADAAFLVALEGPDEVIWGLDSSLRSPCFPLFLGRRSCPPSVSIPIGVRTGTIESVLAEHPWIATKALAMGRRNQDLYGPAVTLDTIIDDPYGEITIRDLPISFDPRNRQFAQRRVHLDRVSVHNPWSEPASVIHDPMTALGG